MRIVVLNGSPKGMTSVTVQYVLFLRKTFPQHELTILNIAQDLPKLEEDEAAFREVLRAVEQADGVLWAFPVYVLLVHAHYKRFIELIFERSAQAAFQGKYAAVLTTSIRFFDHAAHDYLSAICDDLDMQHFGAFSAEMYDLRKEPERRRLIAFAERFSEAIQCGAAMPKRHAPLEHRRWTYTPGEPGARLDSGDLKVLVLADLEDPGANLRRMVERFCACFAAAPEVVDLRRIDIRGGCLGCIHCGLDNVCVYRDADDVHATYQRLMAADVLVFACAIHDRHLSSRWKLFCDRGFFHNHVPMFVGKQIGWLVSGPLCQIPNLRQSLAAYAELEQANLVDVVTDECGDSPQLDRLVESLAQRLIRCAQTGYIGPPTFLGVGGGKILRDEIWATMRSVFPMDHQYYKRHGLYRFPRRSLKTRLSDALMGMLLRIPSFRQEFRRRIKTEMIKPLEEVLKDS